MKIQDFVLVILTLFISVYIYYNYYYCYLKPIFSLIHFAFFFQVTDQFMSQFLHT